jgi:hypothetical protein
MPQNESIHDEARRRDEAQRRRETAEEDEALAEIEKLAADDDPRPDDFGEVPPELEEQLAEAKRDLDAEEPDALARHALEAAVGNDE